ncbi:MAG: hypothetical protein U0441_17765 [Polyangiaceae bacterium]
MSNVPWYRRKGLVVAVVAVVATLAGMRIGVAIWGRSHLAKFVKDSQIIWDDERARLLGMKNPLDPEAKDACPAAYRSAGIDLGASDRVIGMALLAGAGNKVPEDAATIVAQEKGAVTGFLKATKCGGYAPKADEAWTTYERLFPFFNAGRLVIVDARMRADAGDMDAALDRLLAVVKAGTDLGTGSLMSGVHGAAVSAPALETLAWYVADGRLTREQRERVAHDLALLAPRMPSVLDGVIKERLRYHAIAVEVATTGVAPPDARPMPDDPARFAAAVMPTRAIIADALSKQDRFMSDVQDIAMKYRDPIEFVIRVANAEPRAATRRMSGFDFPPYGLMQKGHNLCLPRAWTQMILEALTIEKTGAPPATLPKPIDDPCGAGPLVYYKGATAGSYTFESVGKDGAVSDDDLRLVRKPPTGTTPTP